MICFICDLNAPTLPSLVAHFKILHLLGPFSTYMCKENECHKSFQSLSSFKKHIQNNYISIKNCINVNSLNNSITAENSKNYFRFSDKYYRTTKLRI